MGHLLTANDPEEQEQPAAICGFVCDDRGYFSFFQFS